MKFPEIRYFCKKISNFLEIMEDEVMAMAWIWTGMVVLSVVFGAATGHLGDVSAAALGGARSAVELVLSMAGTLCLWSGVMEVMDVSGLSSMLAKAFRRCFCFAPSPSIRCSMDCTCPSTNGLD